MSEMPRTDELRDKLARLGWNPHKDNPVADLFVEMDKLEGELADMTKQRNTLAETLKSLCRAIISEEPQDITDLLKQSGSAIAAVEGGNDE